MSDQYIEKSQVVDVISRTTFEAINLIAACGTSHPSSKVDEVISTIHEYRNEVFKGYEELLVSRFLQILDNAKGIGDLDFECRIHCDDDSSGEYALLRCQTLQWEVRYTTVFFVRKAVSEVIEIWSTRESLYSDYIKQLKDIGLVECKKYDDLLKGVFKAKEHPCNL